MESLTYLKNVRIPPKKLRFLLEDIKKNKPAVAMQRLMYSSTRPGQILYQSIKSAIFNAKHTLNIEDSLLQFKTLTIEEGQKIKRGQSGSRGTVKPINKRYSHIKIILVGPDEAKVNKGKTAEAKSPKDTSAKVQETAKEVKTEDKKAETKSRVSKVKNTTAKPKTSQTKKVSK